MAVAAIGGFLLAAGDPAGAVHDVKFQLDGNVAAASYPGGNVANQPYDWDSFFNNSGPGGTGGQVPGSLTNGFVASGFKADFALPDSSTFATGSKDTLNIGGGGWQCTKSNNVGDKVDIVNAYSVAYRDPTSNHLILYFGMEKSSPNGDSNIGMWFLKDGTVGCDSTGGTKDFAGNHQDGDLLVVSSFTNGGDVATVQAFRWQGGANGSLNTTPATTGGKCPAPSTPDPIDPATGLPAAACATVNNSPVTPTWAHPDKDGGALNALEFFEGGVDLTALHDEQCFARFLGNTRSSQSPTATIFDFATGSLPVCGTLHVNKYIDANVNGVRDAAEATTNADRAGYHFTVTGPNGDSTVVCSGTTDTAGNLTCSTGSLVDIPVGDYVITETQKTGFYNTDPGSGSTTDRVNTAASMSKTATVSSGDVTVLFGNTCFVDKAWTINGVPSGTSGMFVDWQVTSGHNAGRTGTTALTVSGSTATGSLNDTLVQSDTIDWQFGTNNDHTRTVVGQTSESLANFGYPTCRVPNSATFPLARLTGTKYKDVDSSGTRNTGDIPGPGFTFQLKNGAGTVLQTSVSDASGNYSFSNVAPGTYAVHELPLTGWVQTQPANGADRTIVVLFGDTAKTIAAFGNTPLSNITVTFANQAVNPGTTTPATKATITCNDGTGSQTGNTYSTTGVHIGTYQCTVTITDP